MQRRENGVVRGMRAAFQANDAVDSGLGSDELSDQLEEKGRKSKSDNVLSGGTKATNSKHYVNKPNGHINGKRY